MRQTDLKEKSSVFFISKWIIIGAIIIISSFGFTLGFFVGKSFRPPAEDRTPLPPPPQSIEQINITPEEKGTVSQKPEQTQVSHPQTVAQKTEDPQRTQETKKAQVSPQESQKTVETNKTGGKQQSVQTQQNLKLNTQKTDGNQDAKASQKTRKYTVQAGAFKNVSDAESLKAKLDKKGYKTAITVIETKKHEKLYKVHVGEFNRKKEADLLAVKLKKGEGLKPFVTFKP